MLIPPKYILTPDISQALQTIEACKQVIDSVEIPPEIEQNIRRQSTLRSSLFSARIEGNTQTLETLSKNSKEKKNIEVFNIFRSLSWIQQKNISVLSAKDILALHKIVMENLIDKHDYGKFRTEVGAIFNGAGIVVYLPPRPGQIPVLIKRLVHFANNGKEQFVPVKAVLTHYTFEKIHPFLDGNGRVGRLVLQLVLTKDGYGMKGLPALEEYLDSHRLEYYQALSDTERDATGYVEFMLEAIAETSEIAKKLVLEKKEFKAEDLLLPRRIEILNIIRDQGLISFDTIRRRFLQVNERTLRNDLKKLRDKDLIRKRGTTKGVYYEAKNVV